MKCIERVDSMHQPENRVRTEFISFCNLIFWTAYIILTNRYTSFHDRPFGQCAEFLSVKTIEDSLMPCVVSIVFLFVDTCFHAHLYFLHIWLKIRKCNIAYLGALSRLEGLPEGLLQLSGFCLSVRTDTHRCNCSLG